MKRHAESIVEIGHMKAALHATGGTRSRQTGHRGRQKDCPSGNQIDHDIIQSLVHVALTHVAEKSPVIVHVNPADYSYLLEPPGGIVSIGGREMFRSRRINPLSGAGVLFRRIAEILTHGSKKNSAKWNTHFLKAS